MLVFSSSTSSSGKDQDAGGAAIFRQEQGQAALDRNKHLLAM
jgi:hypothetical protein